MICARLLEKKKKKIYIYIYMRFPFYIFNKINVILKKQFYIIQICVKFVFYVGVTIT